MAPSLLLLESMDPFILQGQAILFALGKKCFINPSVIFHP